MAQIVAEVKGLAARVTILSEREAERSERTAEILTRIEAIEARMNELEVSAGDGIGTRGRKSGGSRGVTNEHPMLKVCRNTISSVPSRLKTSACGTHDLFSDVWSGGVGEQGEAYQRFVWGGTAEKRCAF
jgi:hypothetical protein